MRIKQKAAEEGSNEYQIEGSKKATTTINSILGDPKRLKIIAEDFVKHYDKRVSEGSTVNGKAMFVCSSREIGYNFYKNVIALKPEWAKVKVADKLIDLAKAVKDLVDGQAKFPDWSKREDIKSALKVGLILLLDEHGYPPVERDEVYKDIFEQAENFKKNRK